MEDQTANTGIPISFASRVLARADTLREQATAIKRYRLWMAGGVWAIVASIVVLYHGVGPSTVLSVGIAGPVIFLLCIVEFGLIDILMILPGLVGAVLLWIGLTIAALLDTVIHTQYIGTRQYRLSVVVLLANLPFVAFLVWVVSEL